jgi:hypothetical protein
MPTAGIEIERRVGSIAEVESEGNKLHGYAAVFNQPSENLGGFREFIAPGAFKRTLDSNEDVRALLDHDTRLVLGRRSAGTLRLHEDTRGLAVEIDLPSTSYAKDAAELIRRGDVSQMSFGFTISKGDDEWLPPESDEPLRRRIVRHANLMEVSVVSIPAYPQTEVGLRSLSRFLLSRNTNILQVIGLRRF